MKGQHEQQPKIAKGNLLTWQPMLTHSINSLPCCTPEEAAGGSRWRFPGKRGWSEGRGGGHGGGYSSVCWETSLHSAPCQEKHPCSAVLEEEQEPVAL